MYASSPIIYQPQKANMHYQTYGVGANHDPFLNLLPQTDQNSYIQLCHFFAIAEDRNKRNLGTTTFIKHLTMIHDFINQNDKMDGIRGMLCGIHFGTNSFLINTSKLKSFMNRSKSCINGCFQKIGCAIVKPAKEIATLLTEIHPAGAPIHHASSRQWCVRMGTDSAAVCFMPTTGLRLAYDDIIVHKNAKKTPLFYFDIGTLLNHKSTFDYDRMCTPKIREAID